MNQLKINQDNTRTETNVSDNVIELLYNEFKVKSTHDQNTLIGRVDVDHGYEDSISFLNNNYRNFRCISVNDPYIRFVDPAIEQLLINRLIQLNFECNGIGLTQDNLNQISTSYFFDSFHDHNEIITFPEFNRLTNYKVINSSFFKNCTNLESINLSNITSITASYCFQNTKLSSIDLPLCTSITGNDVFLGCTSLTSFNAPVLTTISSYNSFDDCTNLQSINAPCLTTLLGKKLFKNCTNLTTINAPDIMITQVYEYMFDECNNLENINFDLSNITQVDGAGFRNCYKLDLSTLNFSVLEKINYNAFNGCTLPTTIDLSTCTQINNEAFENCKGLINVENTQNVTTIDKEAFHNCASLTSFEDFSNVTTISTSAFSGTNLSGSIDLSSCTSLGRDSFSGTKITNVRNTLSLTTLDSIVFENCTELLSIDSLENVVNFIINGYQFNGCTKLGGEINLSNIIPTGGSGYLVGNFYNCNSVKRIKLGDLKFLGVKWNAWEPKRQAFRNCTSLHTLDIKSLEYITPFEWSGLHTCTNLVNIIIRSTTIPGPSSEYTSQYTSILLPNQNIKIYVPDSAVNDYKAATLWSDISDYIFPLSTYVPLSVD